MLDKVLKKLHESKLWFAVSNHRRCLKSAIHVFKHPKRESFQMPNSSFQTPLRSLKSAILNYELQIFADFIELPRP